MSTALHDETVLVTLAIDAIPQVFEEDAVALLHAVEVAIRRSGNMHLDRWQITVDQLHTMQAWLADEAEADRQWRGVFA